MRKEIQKRILTLAFLLLATLAVGQTLKGKVTDNEKETSLRSYHYNKKYF